MTIDIYSIPLLAVSTLKKDVLSKDFKVGPSWPFCFLHGVGCSYNYITPFSFCHFVLFSV